MIEKLERLIDEIGAVHSKLILLVGAPRTGKTALLCTLAKSRNATSLNIGAALGSRLSAIPQKQRHLQANTILRELTDQHAKGDLFLVDNIELLFDRTLQLRRIGNSQGIILP
jgi:chloramphenicol 3-O-phosphotransferase